MEFTYLDYFNFYLKEFLNKLILNYPEYKKALIANYRSFLEGREDKSDLYVKYYYSKINDHLERIAHRDVTLFTESDGCYFIEGLDFVQLWRNDRFLSNDENASAVWRYLQILMILGRRIIPDHKEITDLLKRITDGQIAIPAKVEKTLDSGEIDDDGEDKDGSSGGGLGDLLGGLGGLGNLASLIGGNKSGNSNGDGSDDNLLGKLLSGFNIGEVMKTMSEGMGEILKAQQSQTPAAADTTSPSTSTDTINISSDAATTNMPTNVPGESQNGGAGATGATGGTGASGIGDFAKEFLETIDMKSLLGDKLNPGSDSGSEAGPGSMRGNPGNMIQDMIKNMMSGDNAKKMGNLLQKYGSKFDADFKNGNIKMDDMIKQTMNAMKSHAPHAANAPSARDNAKREELKAKYAEKMKNMKHDK